MPLDSDDLDQIGKHVGRALVEAVAPLRREVTARHGPPRNGAAKWWAIGVVVAALGGLVTIGAIGDWFVFTEAEASDFKADNLAEHVSIRKSIVDNEHAQQLRDQRIEHNIERIADKLRVPDIRRAPPPSQ